MRQTQLLNQQLAALQAEQQQISLAHQFQMQQLQEKSSVKQEYQPSSQYTTYNNNSAPTHKSTESLAPVSNLASVVVPWELTQMYTVHEEQVHAVAVSHKFFLKSILKG